MYLASVEKQPAEFNDGAKVVKNIRKMFRGSLKGEVIPHTLASAEGQDEASLAAIFKLAAHGQSQDEPR